MEGVIGMNENVEAARKENIFIVELLDLVDDEVMERIYLGSQEKNLKKMDSAIIDLITEFIECSLEDGGIKKNCDRYKKALKYNCMDKGEEYIEYCYMVEHVLYECIYLSYPIGKSYDEFITGILERENIEIDPKENVKLVRNFKNDLLKLNGMRSVYAAQIKLYRSTHVDVEMKNKNRKKVTEESEANEIPTYYYPSILEFDEAAREFEFYIKKNNEKADGTASDTYNRLMQLSRKKLSPILGGGLDESIKKFQKIRKTAIKDMSEEQLEDFRDYLEAKLSFIEQYAPERYKELGRWSLYEDYYINRIHYDVLAPGLPRFYFPALGRALSECIRSITEKLKEENVDCLWRELVVLADRTYQMRRRLQEERGEEDRFDFFMDLREFRKIWEEIPVFDEKQFIACVKENWMKGLEGSDYGLKDFIKLLVLCMTTESCGDKEINDLTEDFMEIFRFLSNCKEKEVREKEQCKSGKRDYTINLKAEIRLLYDRFKSRGIDLPDGYEHQFDERSYFFNRYKTRYMNIIYQMKKLAGKNPQKIDRKELAEKYIRSILFPQNSNWQIVSEKLDQDLSTELLTWIFKCLFPNVMTEEDVRSIYERKERVLEILGKYNSTEGLGL